MRDPSDDIIADAAQLQPADLALADLVTALAQVPLRGLDPAGRAALAGARAAVVRLAAVDPPPTAPAPPGMPDLSGHVALVAAPELPRDVPAALRAAGARVFLAPTEAAARAWLEIAPCDLALLARDLDAPDGGVHVAGAIRTQHGAPGRVPVLGLGAWGDASAQLDAELPALATPEAVARALGRIWAACDAALVADGAAEPVVDAERYGRLIEMAGAEAARELLERLGEDLLSVSRGLGRALDDGPAAAEVRAHTHVLISLAGAVGAHPLQRLAEALNAAANRGASADMQRLGAITLERLAALMHFVAAQEAQPTGDGEAA